MITVLLDIDGVVADYVGHICNLLQTRGILYSPEEFTDWDLSKVLDPESLNILRELSMQRGFCEQIPLYSGAHEFLGELAKETDFIALTAPTPSLYWTSERQEWIEPWSPFVIHCPSHLKHLVGGDILIEDNLHTVKAWAAAHPRGRAILFDRPWNADDAVFSCYTRVHTYQRALQIVMELSNVA